ncbi:MAG TPA: hypothetical protein VGQ72_16215 [Pyrinomonadaceae bacterium]|jgi:hypothetical protein|nr:hypothetical protein [Pyrinomonadaceae bacterium]
MNLFSRGTLFQLLIGKSVAEALLVTAVAAGFYLTTTNPNLRGWLDQADTETVSGWAVDDGNAANRVDVQLFIDDRFIEQRSANDFRPDVHQAKRAEDDWHGFVFKTPALPPGEHEARVYAVYRGASATRRTLQIIGKPLHFRINAAPGQ